MGGARIFRLRGWCMLGVFHPFTRLGHECQDLWSPCDGMHMCTDQTSLYTLARKSLGEWNQNMLTPTEKSLAQEKFSSEEDRTHDAASSRTASPTRYQRAIPAPSWAIRQWELKGNFDNKPPGVESLSPRHGRYSHQHQHRHGRCAHQHQHRHDRYAHQHQHRHGRYAHQHQHRHGGEADTHHRPLWQLAATAKSRNNTGRAHSPQHIAVQATFRQGVR